MAATPETVPTTNGKLLDWVERWTRILEPDQVHWCDGSEAEDVTGPYDVIVRAEAKNVDELGKLVVAKIQGVEGITRTLTCPVVHL